MADKVIHVSSKEEFDKIIAEAGDNKVVAIDFFAEWCGPCKMISPKFKAMSNEFTNIIFLKVDVDQLEAVALQYGITAMPTFIFIKGGKKLEEFKGANDQKLRETLGRFAAISE
eukprot:CAMPEP_0184643256 /NCGR_PEP_ID=MMETSP0308-20130426/58_1 /TAXON_ID=38269 /ORGANISM="Gloeochaete witrockiana, Strain SAG 46.84" /LENGTH=113 /DNA_ID=CAMNT_0027071051 /DNA_START=103 /DNA_END=444 /DNA_ORIENTATION=+